MGGDEPAGECGSDRADQADSEHVTPLTLSFDMSILLPLHLS